MSFLCERHIICLLVPLFPSYFSRKLGPSVFIPLHYVLRVKCSRGMRIISDNKNKIKMLMRFNKIKVFGICGHRFASLFTIFFQGRASHQRPM